MSVSCVTRQSIQTSVIQTNDVISRTRTITISGGGGVQTTYVPFATSAVCVATTINSSASSSCTQSTLMTPVPTTIPGTQGVSQIVEPVTVAGYTTFLNTLYETICTTIQTPISVPLTIASPTTDPPTPSTSLPPSPSSDLSSTIATSMISPPLSPLPSFSSSDRSSKTSTSLTALSTLVTLSSSSTTTTTTTIASITSTTRQSTLSTSSISRSTVGPSDDPSLISSLAVQESDQPSASSSSSDGVPIASIVGGVVGGVGGALLLGLFIYFLLFRRSNKYAAKGPLYNYGQTQIDPRHYEYTPVQSDQGYQFGRMLEQGDSLASQLSGPQYATAIPFDPFVDQQDYYQGPGNMLQGTQAGYVAVGAYAGGPSHARQESSATGSSVGSGSVSSTAPIIRQQPAYGSTTQSTQRGQYRGLAEPIDSRF